MLSAVQKDSPLAQDFLITTGIQEITVPVVPDGNYIIICEFDAYILFLQRLTNILSDGIVRKLEPSVPYHERSHLVHPRPHNHLFNG